MAANRRLPSAVKGPLGLGSLVLGIVGAVVGYVFVILGITMYFDLNSLTISNTQSMVIVVAGFVSLAVAYAGWRGFMRLAY